MKIKDNFKCIYIYSNVTEYNLFKSVFQIFGRKCALIALVWPCYRPPQWLYNMPLGRLYPNYYNNNKHKLILKSLPISRGGGGGGGGYRSQTQSRLYCILDFCKSETHQLVLWYLGTIMSWPKICDTHPNFCLNLILPTKNYYISFYFHGLNKTQNLYLFFTGHFICYKNPLNSSLFILFAF